MKISWINFIIRHFIAEIELARWREGSGRSSSTKTRRKLWDFHFASIMLFVEAFQKPSVERKTNGAENRQRREIRARHQPECFLWLSRMNNEEWKKVCSPLFGRSFITDRNQLSLDCGLLAVFSMKTEKYNSKQQIQRNYFCKLFLFHFSRR